jgi:branched-chain amino acid transport system permease protein
MFFNRELGVGGLLSVGRFGFHGQIAYFTEMVILFAMLAVGVLALRRGPFGRQLAAMNDSEMACSSIGMNVAFTKIVAFTLAAGIAGLGGAAYGGWQHQVSPNDFVMLKNLFLLLIIALGGIATVGGAFAAAVFYAVNPIIQRHLNLDPMLLVGLGALGLGRNQGGAAGGFADAIDRIRQWQGARSRSGAPATNQAVASSDGEEAQLVGFAP